jgi:hypothetical protein
MLGIASSTTAPAPMTWCNDVLVSPNVFSRPVRVQLELEVTSLVAKKDCCLTIHDSLRVVLPGAVP